MDFVKQQINSAVKTASSGTTTNDKDKNNADPKSSTMTAQQDQSQAQQPDLAKAINQTMASLQAGGGGGGKGAVGGGLLPAELSSEQLSQLGRELGAGVAAERAKNPDKSAEAIGADTLKRVRDLQSQGQDGLEGVGGEAAALRGRHVSAGREGGPPRGCRAGPDLPYAARAAAAAAGEGRGRDYYYHHYCFYSWYYQQASDPEQGRDAWWGFCGLLVGGSWVGCQLPGSGLRLGVNEIQIKVGDGGHMKNKKLSANPYGRSKTHLLHFVPSSTGRPCFQIL
ncbi:hypothetical protein PG997_003815 [Apiospora hydei]|uniref:Uncharacterized protein n=1 Tax=Apiospora hydei TaxID=1337664 RepID=A0ABR1X091_9PEZI